MSSIKTDFYPTVTSPYRKLLQIGGAIILLALLLNQLFVNHMDNKQELDKHFQLISDSYIQQAVNTGILLLNNKDKKQVLAFVDSLAETDLVKDAILYDLTGQVIAQSRDSGMIKELYGLEQGSNNVAPQTLTVVQEIRTDKLLGFIRLTFNKSLLIDPLETQLKSQSEIIRLMIILAIFAGFLLTRGFARFSRQGVRLVKVKPKS